MGKQLATVRKQVTGLIPAKGRNTNPLTVRRSGRLFHFPLATFFVWMPCVAVAMTPRYWTLGYRVAFVASITSIWISAVIARRRGWSSLLGIWLAIMVHPFGCWSVTCVSRGFQLGEVAHHWSLMIMPSVICIIVSLLVPASPRRFVYRKADRSVVMNAWMGPVFVLAIAWMLFPLDFRSPHSFPLWIVDLSDSSGLLAWDFNSVSGYAVTGTTLDICDYDLASWNHGIDSVSSNHLTRPTAFACFCVVFTCFVALMEHSRDSTAYKRANDYFVAVRTRAMHQCGCWIGSELARMQQANVHLRDFIGIAVVPSVVLVIALTDILVPTPRQGSISICGTVALVLLVVSKGHRINRKLKQ